MCLPTKSSSRVLLTFSDSIAISILDHNTILRGVGNELHLHSNKHQVLDIRLKGKVHGIENGIGANSKKLLVFGEKEFILLEWVEEEHFREQYRGQLTDWISAATFLEDGKEFVLLTAHSVLLHFRYTLNQDLNATCTIVERISCVDKSTLYCAHLHGKTWTDLVIFGGNAFGELLLWKPKENITENGKREAQLLQRMTAHNGVIFHIDYSEKRNLLITTSDDRSISFWKVDIKTGWGDALIKPIASGYGHQARVFSGRIIDYENITYALTTGEDSHFCLWHCNGELVTKKRLQFGATIWNLVYDEKTHTIYTVGSSGNIVAYSLKDIFEDNGVNIERKLMRPDLSDDTEYMAKIKFLSKTQLIGLTNRNQLALNDLENEGWHKLNAFDNYKCTVLEVYGKLIALCGYKRFTLLEEIDGIPKVVYDSNALCGVIRSFHFLSETQYLLSDDQGNCVFLKRERLQIPQHIELPKCKERWLTAALLITDDLLLVSNRLGNIMLYEYTSELNSFELKHILKHPHGYLGATLLKLLEINVCESSAYVQSAGHDGSLKTLLIDFDKTTVNVISHQIVPVAWIETTATINDTEVFLGFNDNHFVTWTEEHDTTLQVACGGGHRCWHFYIYNDKTNAQRIKLVFIKNKNVLLHDLPLFNRLIGNIILPYRNRWHTRPCNVLTTIKSSEEKKLITISGGDDNLIKVSTLINGTAPASLQQMTEIHTHISNVRALKAFNTSPNRCLIFSGGGRAQLCATAINLQNFKVTQLLNYTLKTEQNLTSTSHSFDPETRIMSVDVINTMNSQYNIYAACSDGFLRRLLIDKDFNVHLEKMLFFGKCLLHVRLVADLYVLIATTDGLISFFNLELSKAFLKVTMHSSGINALDIYYDTETQKLHLLTGGDDQSVAYSQVSLKDLHSPILLETRNFPQLHTAQVTAVKFLNGARYILTSGVDQNLIQFDLEEEQILSVLHSCVADIKGLTLDNETNLCLLYGCGLQIFQEYS